MLKLYPSVMDPLSVDRHKPQAWCYTDVNQVIFAFPFRNLSCQLIGIKMAMTMRFLKLYWKL